MSPYATAKFPPAWPGDAGGGHELCALQMCCISETMLVPIQTQSLSGHYQQLPRTPGANGKPGLCFSYENT